MSSPLTRPQFRFAPPTAFARDLNTRVHEALAGMGENRFGDARLWVRVSLVAAVGAAAYGLLLRNPGSLWLDAISIVVAAVCAFMLMVQLGHDAAHGSVSRKPWVNRLALFLTFAILGVDGALWRDRHNRIHHPLPNVPGNGVDTDVIGGVFRLASHKNWHWWMRLQPFYAPLLYSLGHASLVWVEDFGLLRRARAGGRTIAVFVLGKAIHGVIFLWLPWATLDPSMIDLALGYALASGSIALAFAILTFGNHISDLAECPSPAADGMLPHDWATHQLVTSVDWSPSNPVALFFSGGANAHAAHHLFPGHSHRHMALLSRIIAQTAHEHGLRHQVTDFRGMLRGHVRHLVALSRPDGHIETFA